MEKQEEIRKERAFKSMLIFGIFSIVMLFAGLTSAYIVSKGALSAEGKWDFINLPIDFRFSTIAIILSSFSAVISFSDLKRNNFHGANRYLFFTFILALIFSFFQFKGWSHLVNEGHFFAGKESNVASSFIYVLTGVHFAHVVAGLIVLLVLINRVKLKKYTPKTHLGFKLGLWFWHFLGILWVYLYGFLLYSNSNGELKKKDIDKPEINISFDGVDHLDNQIELIFNDPILEMQDNHDQDLKNETNTEMSNELGEDEYVPKSVNSRDEYVPQSVSNK